MVAQAPAGPPSPPSALDVLPFPGTPDASPQTAISFPALSASQLRSVTVTGSRSGIHSGQLIALPNGRGTAFTPARPFANSERVTVRATLSSKQMISFSFGVEAPLARGPLLPDSLQPAVRHDVRDANGFTHSFRSKPGLHPPIEWLSGADSDPGSGYIFADAQNTIQPGPMILDPAGHLVWFEPLHHSAALNVQVQGYQGRSVLTYWQGYVIPPGVGVGTDVILDHSYQTVATVNAGNGYQTDLHEFQITPQGTALITAYAPVTANLHALGGPRNGFVLDSIVQEVDIASGKVLWEWHAYGHVHLDRVLRGQANRQALRLLPRQLGAAATERQPAGLRSAHVGRVRDRQADGEDPVGAGGQALELQDRPGRQLRLAARRPDAARRHDHRVRQRCRHLQEREPVARAPDPP